MRQEITDSQAFDEETEFEQVLFKNIALARRELESYHFVDCTFQSCDFSMVKLDRVVFNNVKFKGCKLVGVDFSRCSRFTFFVDFEECMLDFSFFSKNIMKKVRFSGCSMKEASFEEVDLSGASFAGCGLANAAFERCNLAGCDFRTAREFSFNPSSNKMKKAMFSYPGVLGLLEHLDLVIDD